MIGNTIITSTGSKFRILDKIIVAISDIEKLVSVTGYLCIKKLDNKIEIILPEQIKKIL